METMLETINLCKYYGENESRVNAIDNTSMKINEGEFVVIVGKSGSGKSTLLHMLGGLDKPTSGKVYINGKDIFNLSDEKLAVFRRRKIGFIFQAFNLISSLNVWENIVLPIGLDNKKVDKEFTMDIVKTLGIETKLNNYPRDLSGGQQQRVAIARAIAAKPNIILRIHEFGKLRALGTTKKQLKSIIKREGLLLSILSIPLGLLAGYIGTDIFFYKVWMNYLSEFSSIKVDDVSIFNGYIMVGVAFITLIIVYLSLNKPMRTACNVSAVDAIRYDESSKSTKRKGYFEINLLKLTASNFVRNKKRTITTILTMGLSCIFFVVIANLVESMDPSNVARREVEKGDFCISIDGEVNDVTYPENNYNNLQKQNIMNDDFLNSINKIDGVTNIEKRSIVLGQFDNFEFKDGKDNLCLIDVLSREDFDARIKDFKRGEMDYNSASDNNGIIYEYDNFFDENGFEIGKDYDFTLFDGSEKIAFKGNLQGSCQSSQSSFIMTEDTFNKLNVKNNLTTKIWISCDKNKEPNIKKVLNNMISANEHLQLKSYSEELKNSKIAIRMYGMPVYAALIILGVIGFMNMANTLITSIITRKKELGILQAIGLTTRQLNKMLQLEGLIYTISTVFIACSLGNALGYMVCLHCQKVSLFGISEYHFPYLELGIMVAALIILQGILSYILSKKLQKTSLVERIKYSE